MTQQRYFHDATAPAVQHSVEAGKHCAYNRSRERFLSADVDAADFSGPSLDTRLPALTPTSGAGLWLIPFRGISPTSVRIPVDLIYLDRNCAVIETVESFPIARASASSPASASVLVLPANSIRSTETQCGDQLILCAPDEMKRVLQRLAGANADGAPEQSAKDWVVRGGSTGRLLQWEDRNKAKNPTEETPVDSRADENLPGELAVTALEPQMTPAAEPVQQNIKPAKSWLRRLLSPDPPQPRKSQRESLPGLSAYFFTGGTPVAHGVRDISLTGMYVFTSERWYLGTMVRMTLTDRLEPTAERSITLNASVIRWGNDGVGLKFIFQSTKDRRQRQSDGLPVGVDQTDIERFLQRLRTTKN